MSEMAGRANAASAYQVEVSGLVKHFHLRTGFLRRSDRVVRAVDGVSLSIAANQTLGLVGESGCGKTTLGRCLLRLIEPTAGKIYFEGVNLLALPSNQMREIRREMQIVFQNPFSSLDPRMSVYRLIGEPLRAHGSSSHSHLQEQVVALLEQVGMSSECLYRYPHEFSGGQLQRIAIARALALRPKFMVLDEPTAALDVSVQAHIIMLLMDLQRELDLTYLFISHNLTLVHYVSDTIAVLYMGKIVEMASATGVFENPLHPYTEALLSATPYLDPGLRKERIVLQGSVPDPVNPPRGCSFHPRCPYVMGICREEMPLLRDLGGGHLVACHLGRGRYERKPGGDVV